MAGAGQIRTYSPLSNARVLELLAIWAVSRLPKPVGCTSGLETCGELRCSHLYRATCSPDGDLVQLQFRWFAQLVNMTEEALLPAVQLTTSRQILE
ncbi:hypothetical protein RRG08_016089 [Elysia crispata]|uniref:Uncharacterized protein n=1 Tax=Elysia crispata TaxID=231223 RepID=A0AAE1DKF0_9GAST|nr:hypothetical protein RRG08_016089 [Elysia crispata]